MTSLIAYNAFEGNDLGLEAANSAERKNRPGQKPTGAEKHRGYCEQKNTCKFPMQDVA